MNVAQGAAKRKPGTNLGLNGIWTYDCDTGAVLYQLGAGQYVNSCYTHRGQLKDGSNMSKASGNASASIWG